MKSIRKNANSLFDLAFKTGQRKSKLINPNIFSDPEIKTVIISKHDPDLVTPIQEQSLPADTKFYVWGFAVGIKEVPTENDFSVGAAIWSMTHINLKFDPTPHLTLSHLVMIMPNEERAGRQVVVYPLSETLLHSMLFGNIKQTVSHKNGKVVSEECIVHE